MPGPVYFVVVNRMGAEKCALYHDWLPAWMTSKNARELGLSYILRLDTLPNADYWLSQSLTQLTDTYFRLKKDGRLPVSNLR
jgi:hypothetical protein